MAMGDIEKMIAVGLIWGSTNALMKKGAIIWETKTLKSSSSPSSSSTPNQKPSSSTSTQTQTLKLHHRLFLSLQNYLNLIITWQYSVPLLLNLSASAAFFAILGHTPISLAVPVTNATTFSVTAVAGMVLGEEMRIGYALFGTLIIVLGVWLCVM